MNTFFGPWILTINSSKAYAYFREAFYENCFPYYTRIAPFLPARKLGYDVSEINRDVHLNVDIDHSQSVDCTCYSCRP